MLRGVAHAAGVAAEEGADVLHHLFIEKSELQLLLAAGVRRRRFRTFGTLFWPYFIHQGDTAGPAVRAVHAANRAALRRLLANGALHTLFVHSPSVRLRLLATLGDRVDPDRILALPDPAVAPTGSREAARQWLAVPEDAPVFLFLGLLSARKGADLLLEALPRLEAEAPGDWRFLVVGQPELVGEPELERCRSRLERPERLVARLGFAPDEDLDRYFLAADAVVLPYRRSHLGTSGILQRAAAAGKVAVVSDVGDIGPTVAEHGLGLVVEPEDVAGLVRALGTVVVDGVDLVERIRPGAHAYAASASWPIVGDLVRTRYRSGPGRPG
jgi:glycosyltransferase involved in cell wall biosynthesis